MALLCPNNTSHEEWRQCLRDFVMNKPYSPIEIILFTFAYGVITAMGLFGNGLVIYVVLYKKCMRNTRNVFIMNLALSNFLLAAIWIPFLWIPTYEVDFGHSVFFCKVAQSFPGINIYCSTLTVSVIAIDRYIVVACSRFGPDRLKVFQAVFIALGIWAVAFGLSVPYLLFFDIDELIIPEEVTREVGFPETSLYKLCAFQPPSCMSIFNQTEQKECKAEYDLVVNVLSAIFLYVVPLFVLFTFNFLLTKFLKSAERQSTALRNRSKLPEGVIIEKGKRKSARRSRTTALLFAMAITYAVLWLPFTILSLYIHLGSGQRDRRELKLADESFKLISMLSICVNPILYGYLNTNFNREFKCIFRRLFPFLKMIDQPKSNREAMKNQMSGFSLLTRDSDSERLRFSSSFLSKNGVSTLKAPRAGDNFISTNDEEDDEIFNDK